MKEFFKNLGRYKVSSVLNILGLSIAFAAAYIILVQVNHDLTYNPASRMRIGCIGSTLPLLLLPTSRTSG